MRRLHVSLWETPQTKLRGVCKKNACLGQKTKREKILKVCKKTEERKSQIQQTILALL